jgi:hypothetical protein
MKITFFWNWWNLEQHGLRVLEYYFSTYLQEKEREHARERCYLKLGVFWHKNNKNETKPRVQGIQARL